MIADLNSLKVTLRESRRQIAETNRQLQQAHASWGIGVNGLGLGVLYVVARVALEGRGLDQRLMLEAAAIAVVVGILLEFANYMFLAKRSTIARLSKQLKREVDEQRDVERKLKESARQGR